MKVTAISTQARDTNRVNVFVDSVYSLSLDITQVAELGIHVGKVYTEEELTTLKSESQFGKVYTKALEYCLLRPHSAKEVRDYLYRKTRDTRTKTGEVKKGVSEAITQRVFARLVEKGYIDDEQFTKYWIEHRWLTKGASKRKLMAELYVKGVDHTFVEQALRESERSDADELQKIIAKKRARYPDEQKLIQYLARQGFTYGDIKEALSEADEHYT